MSVRDLRNRIAGLFLTGVCAAIFFTGCGVGSSEETSDADSVELIDPVGVAPSYETAEYRDLYEAKTYNALVCPYAEEFSPTDTMHFDGYGFLPGETVKKGQMLMESNTEELQKQLEEKNKEIARKEKAYLENVQAAEEALAPARQEEKAWAEVIERYSEEKPDEDAPEYAEWAENNFFYEANYRNKLINLQKKEEALRQMKELYELDAAYDKLLAERLQEDINRKSLLSGMTGVVANITVMNYNDTMEADTPMAAVIDPDRKLIRSEYVSKSAVSKAKEYYAIINGKRYDLEYEVMEQEERNKIADKNGKVYTTFYLKDDADEVEMGSFVTVVFLMEKKENVLTVPSDSVKRDNNTSYVYVLRDNKNVYTPVKTGMKDGYYVEIQSGVEAGEQILTDTAPAPAGSTAVLEKGTISGEYNATGYLFYPVQKLLMLPVKYGTVYYVSTNVELYQSVKKGDSLFTVRVKGDETLLARKERSLQRERERMNDLIRKGEEDNKSAISARQEIIDGLEKEIAEIKADFAVTEIRAPYDGIVTYLPRKVMKTGDLLNKDEPLAVLAAGKSNYIVLKDPNGVLTYNNSVSISYKGVDGKEVTVPGKVMSLGPYSVSQALFADGENTLVKVSPEDVGGMADSENAYGAWWDRNRFDVTATIRSMENVLLVPKKAVYIRDDATYARVKQKDGGVCYQRFVAGGFNSNYYWVAEGLTEGMEVCLE